MNPFQKMTFIMRNSLHFLTFCRRLVLYRALGLAAFFLLTGFSQQPGTKLVVLAGDGHSWKPGIPRQISLRKELHMAVFLPETAKLNRRNVLQTDTDYLWLLRFM
jgi:hypothetical protein